MNSGKCRKSIFTGWWNVTVLMYFLSFSLIWSQQKNLQKVWPTIKMTFEFCIVKIRVKVVESLFLLSFGFIWTYIFRWERAVMSLLVVKFSFSSFLSCFWFQVLWGRFLVFGSRWPVGSLKNCFNAVYLCLIWTGYLL